MDGLALLTNLHADGPVSLRRLRAAGVRSLAGMLELPLASLAEVLRTEESAAQRLHREAWVLAARLLEAPLDSEVVPALPGVEQSTPCDPHAPEDPEESFPPEACSGEVQPRWAAGVEVAPAEKVRDANLHEGGPPMPLPDYPEPTASPVEGTLLRPGRPRGLERRALEGLVREGVRTFRALIDLTNLALSRRADIPFPKLIELRSVARAELRTRLGRIGTKGALDGVPLEPVSSASVGPPDPEPRLRVVELEPRPRAEPAPARSRAFGSYRAERVFAGTRLGRDASRAEEPNRMRDPTPAPTDPGVAGPFV